jgi:hypothetical protein
LRQIIRDTKRTDFYLDAQNALDYGLIDAVVAGELPRPVSQPAEAQEPQPAVEKVAARERAATEPGGAEQAAER